MLLGARQFFERRGAPTPPLPYDAEVEYLESTGTQWIDTGIKPSAEIGILTDVAITYAPYDLGGLSGCTGNSYFAGGGSYSQYIHRSDAQGITVYMYAFGSTAQAVNVSIPYGERAVHKLNWLKDNRCAIEGYFDIALVSPSFFQPYNITVMHLNVSDNPSNNIFYVKGKLYGIKLSNGGAVILNTIPVRFTNELGQSEGAMYDRVSGALFRNAGTGAFLYGNDKS